MKYNIWNSKIKKAIRQIQTPSKFNTCVVCQPQLDRLNDVCGQCFRPLSQVLRFRLTWNCIIKLRLTNYTCIKFWRCLNLSYSFLYFRISYIVLHLNKLTCKSKIMSLMDCLLIFKITFRGKYLFYPFRNYISIVYAYVHILCISIRKRAM
jgi:hypothetical protein